MEKYRKIFLFRIIILYTYIIMTKTDLPTGLIIGTILIVIVFLIGEREKTCKRRYGMPGGCPRLACMSLTESLIAQKP